MSNEKQLLQEIFMFSSEKIMSERFADLEKSRCNGHCASGTCKAMIDTAHGVTQPAAEFWGMASA